MASFHTQILTIEGMQGDESVRQVTCALGIIPAVRVNSVELGHARIMAEPSCELSIREALEQAGFTLSEMEPEGTAA